MRRRRHTHKHPHTTAIIVESCEGGSNPNCVIAFYTAFYRRLSSCDPVICLKALIVYHRVLHEGCPLVCPSPHNPFFLLFLFPPHAHPNGFVFLPPS